MTCIELTLKPRVALCVCEALSDRIRLIESLISDGAVGTPLAEYTGDLIALLQLRGEIESEIEGM